MNWHYPLNLIASAWFGFYIAYSKYLKNLEIPDNALDIAEKIDVRQYKYKSERQAVMAFRKFLLSLYEKPKTQIAVDLFLQELKEHGFISRGSVEAISIFDFDHFYGSGWEWHGMLLYVVGGYFKRWGKSGQMMILRFREEDFDLFFKKAQKAVNVSYWENPLIWSKMWIENCQLYPPFGRVKRLHNTLLEYEKPLYNGTLKSSSRIVEICKDIWTNPDCVSSILKGKAGFNPSLYVLVRYKNQFVFFQPFITNVEIVDLKSSWQNPLEYNIKLKISELVAPALMHQHLMLVDSRTIRPGSKWLAVGLAPIGVMDLSKCSVFCLTLLEGELPKYRIEDVSGPPILDVLNEWRAQPLQRTLMREKQKIKTLRRTGQRKTSLPPRLPNLIMVEDFVDYGKVRRVLKENPNATFKEIVQKTGLDGGRVLMMLEIIKREKKQHESHE